MFNKKGMKYIEYNNNDRICYITLNRPDKKNALNYDFVSELKDAFIKASKDVDCKIIILKANGDVFSAGADLAYLEQLQKNTYEENLADSEHLKKLFELIYKLDKIVIAQVEGHAIAGGCGLATVCDFVFSVPEAKFGYTEVKIGFIPAIVMFFLIRKIGESRAKELLLSGQLIHVDKALEIGLANAIFDEKNIERDVKEFAMQLCNKTSANSLKLTKQLIAQIQSLNLEDALSLASKANAKARNSDDCKKGISAFLKKEKFDW